MDLRMAGDAALVTASSSGLGKAAAKALADEGVNVVVNGRDPDSLAETVEDLEETATGRVVGQPGDLTDPVDIERIANRPITEFGGLDHLVTNSGGPPSGPFLDVPPQEWYDGFELLVMSLVRLIHELAEPLQEGDGGSIVTIASMSVKEAIDSLVLSNSVRMSVVGLEKTLSKELAPEVRVNAVLPNRVETDRIQELVQGQADAGHYETYEEGYDAWIADIPVGRFGRLDEFGALVAFLCSDLAGFINGAAIPVDGGMSRSNV